MTSERTAMLLRALPPALQVDATGWVHLGGTEAGAYFRVADNVVVAVPKPGYIQRESEARKSLEEFHRIAHEAGRPQSVIILVDQVAAQDGSSRRVWSEPDRLNMRRSLALVCSSTLARAIGAFFIGLNRPSVPTRMFKDFPAALRWSLQEGSRE